MKKQSKMKPFSRMSAAAKRVAIAEDVIAQIKAKQYLVERGTWCEIQEVLMGDIVYDQTMLTQGVVIPPPKCTVCAIGAAFASSIRIFNDCEASLENDKNDAQPQLEKFFTTKQLALIENAFENGDGGFRTEQQLLSDEELDDAIAFGRRYLAYDKRALAIFGNIVDNKGVFKP